MTFDAFYRANIQPYLAAVIIAIAVFIILWIIARKMITMKTVRETLKDSVVSKRTAKRAVNWIFGGAILAIIIIFGLSLFNAAMTNLHPRGELDNSLLLQQQQNFENRVKENK
jgi:uncharacterized membrane protein